VNARRSPLNGPAVFARTAAASRTIKLAVDKVVRRFPSSRR
jgi:hypothetical protein